ncbi:DUF4157 domain-containing protein [Ascidiimonas sp. W6]|uniref:eCIS core domain-containing protein n=1 Tax=Ascidiimonas meishanensis TaxID=3128903 RepID=UPI0030ED3041
MSIPENKCTDKKENASSVKSQNFIQKKAVEFIDQRPESERVAQLQQVANQHTAAHPIIQQKTNNTGLPDHLKSGIEQLSGMAMDDVKVHYNSPKPAQLQAHAYAQGTQIHVASGQEKHVPHEAWHVVQQKQGRVKPTKQLKGKVAINDDAGLEKEADVMGAKAMQLKMLTSPEKILERGKPLYFGSKIPLAYQLQPKVIQRGQGSSKVDEDAILEREYKQKVLEATVKLSGKLNFGASPEGKYDKKYWKQIPDKDYLLAIETIVKPSVAIKHLIKAPKGLWSFDCAEYIQVCNLYATMEVYGEEMVNQRSPLVLRQHGSTPFKNAGVTFERTNASAKFDAIFQKAGNAVGENFITEDALLGGIPTGCRVCFKNPVAPDTPFRNENAIYLGGGKYAAHPMGSGLTAANIVDELVRYNERSALGGEDHGRAQIFVSQVELYPSIPMAKATKEALGIAKYEKFL